MGNKSVLNVVMGCWDRSGKTDLVLSRWVTHDLNANSIHVKAILATSSDPLNRSHHVIIVITLLFFVFPMPSLHSAAGHARIVAFNGVSWIRPSPLTI